MTSLTLTKAQIDTINKLEKREKGFSASKNVLSDASIFYGKHNCGKKMCILELIKRNINVERFNKNLILNAINDSTTLPTVISSMITDFTFNNDLRDENYMFTKLYKKETRINTNLIVIDKRDKITWEGIYKKYYKKDLKVIFLLGEQFLERIDINSKNRQDYLFMNDYDIVFISDTKYIPIVQFSFDYGDEYGTNNIKFVKGGIRFNRLILYNSYISKYSAFEYWLIDSEWRPKRPASNFTWFVTNEPNSNENITYDRAYYTMYLDYIKRDINDGNEELYGYGSLDDFLEHTYNVIFPCSNGYSGNQNHYKLFTSHMDSYNSMRDSEITLPDYIRKELSDNIVYFSEELNNEKFNVTKKVEKLKNTTLSNIYKTIKQALNDLNNNQIFLIITNYPDNIKCKNKIDNVCKFNRSGFLKSKRNSIVITKRALQERTDLNLNFVTDIILLDSPFRLEYLENDIIRDKKCPTFLNRCLGYGRTKDVNIIFYANIVVNKYNEKFRTPKQMDREIEEFNKRKLRRGEEGHPMKLNMLDKFYHKIPDYGDFFYTRFNVFKELRRDTINEILTYILFYNAKTKLKCSHLVILNNPEDMYKWKLVDSAYIVTKKYHFKKHRYANTNKYIIVVNINRAFEILTSGLFLDSINVLDACYNKGLRKLDEYYYTNELHDYSKTIKIYKYYNKGYKSLKEAFGRFSRF